ncbi:MAG: 3-phosphoshikimate 1-carboxyvinyltransferase [Alphaproteobacteria bacterium]
MSAHESKSRPLVARRGPALRGTAAAPGDKSVSHRALMLGALAVGETRITGLLEADDVLRTAAAMRNLGAGVVRNGGTWRVHGVGVGGLAEPKGALDFGNSGTGCRLVMGIAATVPIVAVFTGDASLRRRPMKRVLEPLSLFGMEWSGTGGRLPITITGAGDPMPVEYRLQAPSAQVKSAILLAALNAPGRTTVIEMVPTRDHTERLLRAFGADVRVDQFGPAEAISVTGHAELKPAEISIPGDISAAAFPLVAALIVPESDIVLKNVLLNPRRTGLLQTLKEMGASIEITNQRDGVEPVGDLRVRGSQMKGVEVPPERATSMIDEYPVLAVAAALAEGRTIMRGLAELRVKESDRIAAMVAGLRACGVTVEEFEDGLAVEGTHGVSGGATVAAQMDHRIAMSFLVMGLASREPVQVDDGSMIATSFPDFENVMRGLGASIGAAS